MALNIQHVQQTVFMNRDVFHFCDNNNNTQHLMSALSKGQSALHLKLQLKTTHQKIQSMKY